MLPRAHRATSRDIQTARQKKGAHHHSEHLTLVAAPLPEEPQSKCACVISRRVTRKAHERNIFKRRCREALRHSGFPWELDTPHLFLVRAKKGAHELSFKELVQEIEMLREKAMAY